MYSQACCFLFVVYTSVQFEYIEHSPEMPSNNLSTKQKCDPYLYNAQPGILINIVNNINQSRFVLDYVPCFEQARLLSCLL